MPEVSFQPPSTSNTLGKLRIDIEGISGQGGPVYPQLFVLLQITLKSADVHPRVGMGIALPTPEDLVQDYSLHQIYGTLFYGSQGGALVQVANFQSLPISHFSRTIPEAQVNLAIPLDLYRFRLIEAQRVGDVVLRFDFTFHYAKHYQIPRKQANSPIERFESSFIQFTISIPQSYWVTKVLPGLGYRKISWWRYRHRKALLEKRSGEPSQSLSRRRRISCTAITIKPSAITATPWKSSPMPWNIRERRKTGAKIPLLPTRSITCSMCFRVARRDFVERTWRVCAKICTGLPAHQSIPHRRTLRGTMQR